ncbi:IS110 family transposase [Lysobacter alkalisoli]|uniref:IS110 family transposase n=1 Tax=Marilutibacter alkalisoli TaxID=2591633 RepID=A0A514BNW1_9GAMM|nr:IS110 family transposase [Lysobacter alkalisoli]
MRERYLRWRADAAVRGQAATPASSSKCRPHSRRNPKKRVSSSRMPSALACQLPELGRLDGKAIAKLIGVAPLARDSGLMRGRRHVWGDRHEIRAVLYMSMLTAIRYEPRLRDFYQALRTRGKAAKVAIVAAMRKPLVILNARMRDALVEAPQMR